MGFMTPKVPKPAPAPNPAMPALTAFDPATGGAPASASAAASLISTSSRGLNRRASTQRVSLLGGGR